MTLDSTYPKTALLCAAVCRLASKKRREKEKDKSVSKSAETKARSKYKVVVRDYLGTYFRWGMPVFVGSEGEEEKHPLTTMSL